MAETPILFFYNELLGQIASVWQIPLSNSCCSSSAQFPSLIFLSPYHILSYTFHFPLSSHVLPPSLSPLSTGAEFDLLWPRCSSGMAMWSEMSPSLLASKGRSHTWDEPRRDNKSHSRLGSVTCHSVPVVWQHLQGGRLTQVDDSLSGGKNIQRQNKKNKQKNCVAQHLRPCH